MSICKAILSDLRCSGCSPSRVTLRRTEGGMLYLVLILSKSLGVTGLPPSESGLHYPEEKAGEGLGILTGVDDLVL